MKLLFKIFRGTVNKTQMLAFSLVNVAGVLIVLLAVHVYAQSNSFQGSEGGSTLDQSYVVISKPVNGKSMISSAAGVRNTFSNEEMEIIRSLDGVENLEYIKQGLFDVYGGVNLMGTGISTSMFLESVPVDCLDIDLSSVDWHADLDTRVIPVILPKMYLDLYNYGFAPANGYPQINETTVGLIQADLTIYGDTKTGRYKCSLVGLTGRFNSILVPEDFLDAANEAFAPGMESEPSRLVIKVKPGAYAELYNSLVEMGYEPETRTDWQAKMSSSLNIMLIAVMVIGAIFSVLAFFLLLISILLMIEKNKANNSTLAALGYSVRKISQPFQWIALTCDALSVLVAYFGSLFLLQYVNRIFANIQTNFSPIGIGVISLSALSILVLLSVLHFCIIRASVRKSRL